MTGGVKDPGHPLTPPPCRFNLDWGFVWLALSFFFCLSISGPARNARFCVLWRLEWPWTHGTTMASRRIKICRSPKLKVWILRNFKFGIEVAWLIGETSSCQLRFCYVPIMKIDRHWRKIKRFMYMPISKLWSSSILRYRRILVLRCPSCKDDVSLILLMWCTASLTVGYRSSTDCPSGNLLSIHSRPPGQLPSPD
jgi:hypothetical protein